MRLAKDASASKWIHSRLHPSWWVVGAVIPTGFEAYARIFHPPGRLSPDGTETPVRWRDIAAANGRTIQAEMQRLGGGSDPTERGPDGEQLWDHQPRCGTLPHDVAVRLAAILGAHTTTPDNCWFSVWEGWGGLQERVYEAPVVAIPDRTFFLLRGAIKDVTTTLDDVEWIYQSPNLWWPEDRAWCVATEIDFSWTYVGGSRACIDELLKDQELEVLPTHPDEGKNMLPR
jgi:hypothetical protein